MQSATPGCPCGRLDARGRPLPLVQCCGRYVGHFEAAPAPDAEALMRSRYTAFVLQDEPYLLATWHAGKRPSRVRFDAGTRWLGLEVKQHRVVDDTHAEVEFVARCRDAGGAATRMHERSRFVREGGRWFYLEGDHL
jgi:SEC-C motif-containing protein